MDAFRCDFRAVERDDFPLLRRWLEAPHVREWWGDPDHELSLLRDGLETGEVECLIASIDDHPTAYVQTWWPTAYDDEPWFASLSSDTPGIDIFIGDVAMIGKGYGPVIVAAHAERLFTNGAPRLVIDPDARNLRAIRAYAKAGFVPYDEQINGNGRTILMECYPIPTVPGL